MAEGISGHSALSNSLRWHHVTLMQENASLRAAIAVAQQQLHEAAAAAASRVMMDKALEGQQQAAQQANLQVHTLFKPYKLAKCFQAVTYCTLLSWQNSCASSSLDSGCMSFWVRHEAYLYKSDRAGKHLCACCRLWLSLACVCAISVSLWPLPTYLFGLVA